MSGRPIDRHHIKPSSRFVKGENPNTDNIVWLDKKWHAKWHSLFNNMTLDEVCQLLTEMFVPDEVWDINRIKRRMRELKGE